MVFVKEKIHQLLVFVIVTAHLMEVLILITVVIVLPGIPALNPAVTTVWAYGAGMPS